MQAIAEDSAENLTETSDGAPGGVLVISMESVAIILLVLVALGLRVASLGAVPITQAEVQQAVGVWREVSPNAPGPEVISDSPMLFWAQRIGFVFLGSSELAARLLTALAGVFLALSPLLFRDVLGRVRAFSMALLLALSPTLVAASRFSNGTLWAMCFAMIGLWALSRYVQRGEASYGAAAVAMLMAVPLLGGPGGVALAVILVLGGVIALVLNTVEAPDEADVPGDDYLTTVRQSLKGFPAAAGLGIGALLSAAIATGFLIYPDGLSMVGESLGGFLSGFVEPGHPSDPIFFPLVTALFYDTFLWVFAAVAVVLLYRQSQLDYGERFLIGWLAAAMAMSFVWQGGGAAEALWIVVPLAALAAYAISDALADDDTITLWIDGFFENEAAARNTMRVGKWVLAAVSFGLMIMISLHFQEIGRGIHVIPDGTIGGFLERIGEAAFSQVLTSVIWLVISILFMVVGYFLAASIWGNGPAARGVLLGIVAFALMSGVGSGWRVSVAQVGNPVEVWHTVGTDPDAETLRITLQEFAFRETRGQPGIPIAIQADPNGIVAWEVRDFSGAYFVDDLSETRREQFILIPARGVEDSDPDLGGSYVGQNFVISQVWSTQFLQGLDFMPWWAQLQTRFRAEAVPGEAMVLWVRQDIYNSAPVNIPGG